VPLPLVREVIEQVLVPSETLTDPVGVAPAPLTDTEIVTGPVVWPLWPLTDTVGVALATVSVVLPVAEV
jgi:hypothetical protein